MTSYLISGKKKKEGGNSHASHCNNCNILICSLKNVIYQPGVSEKNLYDDKSSTSKHGKETHEYNVIVETVFAQSEL